jgi:hypothetical protein
VAQHIAINPALPAMTRRLFALLTATLARCGYFKNPMLNVSMLSTLQLRTQNSRTTRLSRP